MIPRSNRRGAAVALLLALSAPGWAQAPLFTLFEPAAEGLSLANAYLLAVTSELAYRTKVKDLPGTTYRQKFQERFAPYGLDVLYFVSQDLGKTDTQALLLRNEEVLLVVFSGSESNTGGAYKDWIGTNAKFDLTAIDADGEAMVHSGFLNALDGVYGDVATLVELGLTDGRRLWLTGHSLGGALAALTGYRLALDGIPVQGVHSFASPRIGNEAWVAELESTLGDRVHFWVGRGDPIPRSPYGRTGREYAVHRHTHILSTDGSVELDTVLPEGRRDPMEHRMMEYVNNLYRALPTATRSQVQPPPPVCGMGSVPVGLHPLDELPLCRRVGATKISPSTCAKKEGTVLEDEWCVLELGRDHRHRVRQLKAGPQSPRP